MGTIQDVSATRVNGLCDRRNRVYTILQDVKGELIMEMTIINQINQNLCEESQIYWQYSKGWTSRLWQKLYRLGWRSRCSPAGFRSIIDNEGNEIKTGHLSRVYMLKFIAELMR